MPAARRPSPPASVFAVRAALVAGHRPERAAAARAGAAPAAAAAHAGALAWLAARDADGRLRAEAGRALEALLGRTGAARELRAARADAALATLRAAIDDPALSDERKLELLPLLEACGDPVHPDEVGRSFRRPEHAHRVLVGRQLAALPATPQAIDHELRLAGARGLWPGPLNGTADVDALLTIGSIAAGSHPALAALFLPAVAAAALHAGVGVARALEELGQAAATRHPYALHALRELAVLPAVGAVGERARRLARELEREGIAPAAPPGPPPVRGWASIVDGAGSRQVGLLFRAGRDRAAFCLLLNDLEGVKDVFFVPSGGARLVRGLELAGGVPVAPADLPFARALVADSFDLHERTGRPAPAPCLLYRHLLGEEPLAARPREPDLSAYASDRWPRTPALVLGSEVLARLPLCEELYCASDAAYAFLAARMRRDGVSRVHFDVDADEFRDYLTGIASEERELLTRRLALNLEVEARGGRAHRRENQALARVVVALAESVLPFEEIPFVQALNAAGMALVAQNVALGHRSQREANEAAERA
ncbi:MAG: hypothetical protein MUF27_03415 [Acidobacteria bacterium]|nr:hypothetical protein [Acidobacteriota bacterium]